MTPTEAAAKGYVIDRSSQIDVRLLKNGKLVRTWFIGSLTFGGSWELPGFDNPKIREAIEIAEQHPEIWP